MIHEGISRLSQAVGRIHQPDEHLPLCKESLVMMVITTRKIFYKLIHNILVGNTIIIIIQTKFKIT